MRQASAGVETDDLCEAFGLDPNGPVDAKRMVSSADYYAYLAELARREPDGTTLPLRSGAAMICDDYGAFGLAWKSAPNLRASYDRAERFGRRLTSVSTYTVEAVKGGAFLNLHRDGERHLGMRLSNESTIAALHAISQEASESDFVPIEVRFKHDEPKSIRAHLDYFGCPVLFGSDRDALLVSDNTLLSPNRIADEGISSFFESHLEEELQSLQGTSDLEQRVKRKISETLSDGVPNLSTIAGSLGMGGRTLQRRLSDAGHSYQGLLDAARRELSLRLLRDSSFSLSEIAFLTGFSEQSAFTRAFNRWAGQSPRSYRIDKSRTSTSE